MQQLWMIGVLTAAAFVVPLGSSGCSTDDDHGHADGGVHYSSHPACDAIIKRCHPLDVGNDGEISECHVLAHEATSDGACLARKEACFAACIETADAGVAGDATAD